MLELSEVVRVLMRCAGGIRERERGSLEERNLLISAKDAHILIIIRREKQVLFVVGESSASLIVLKGLFKGGGFH